MHCAALQPTVATLDLQIGVAPTEPCRRAPQPISREEHGELDHCHLDKRRFAIIDDAADPGLPPSTLVALLKDCGRSKSLHKGNYVHAETVKRGLLEHNTFLGSALVSMYAKCGTTERAYEVLNGLPAMSVVAWNALIAGYVQQGKANDALDLYQEMQQDGFSPDSFTFSCILKACSILGALEEGRNVHAQIMQQPLTAKDSVVANALVDMYAKCGALSMACETLDKLCPESNFSWNALIGGFVQHKHGEKALAMFERMKKQGLSPDAVTFFCVLQACSTIGDSNMGREIHGHIVKLGMLEQNIALDTVLIDMYSKCAILEDAQDVFDGLTYRDVVSWNTLMAGYIHVENGNEAMNCFQRMQVEGVLPTAATYSCILNACGIERNFVRCQEMHALILREHFFRKDIVVSTSLLATYAKCGALLKAQEIFDEVVVRDIVLWNELMTAYAQQGLSEDALVCFKQMQADGFAPNAVSFEWALKACGNIGAAVRGQQIHDQIQARGFFEKDRIVALALVDMHFKFGDLEKAQELFDRLSVQDADTWSVLITGYVQHQYYDEALYFFQQMQGEGVSPNAGTFACILKACASMGTLCLGQKLHADCMRLGILDEDSVTRTSLVDMYARCGMVREAQESFDVLASKDVVSWSALIEGYAQYGEVNVVFSVFKRMQGDDVQPSPVTFTIMLSACSHMGLVSEFLAYLVLMSIGYGFLPSPEHHNCIVDLFCRIGQLDVAVAVIEVMPTPVPISIWHTLLGACRNLETMKLEKGIFECATESDRSNNLSFKNCTYS